MRHFTKTITPFLWITLLVLQVSCTPKSHQTSTGKQKVIYVYDPLCGWCYGFSPIIEGIANKYKDEVDFEVLAGGLVTDSMPIISWKGFIIEHQKFLEEETGIKYGKAFLKNTLNDSSVYFSSVEPAMAIHIIQEHAPSKAIEFLVTVQQAIYYDGINPMRAEEYLPYIKGYGIDENEFLTKMNSSEYRKTVTQGFYKAAKLGVDGYPNILLDKGDKMKKIIPGYISEDKAFKKFERAIK